MVVHRVPRLSCAVDVRVTKGHSIATCVISYNGDLVRPGGGVNWGAVIGRKVGAVVIGHVTRGAITGGDITKTGLFAISVLPFDAADGRAWF